MNDWKSIARTGQDPQSWTELDTSCSGRSGHFSACGDQKMAGFLPCPGFNGYDCGVQKKLSDSASFIGCIGNL
jgi:hypothetical protein